MSGIQFRNKLWLEETCPPLGIPGWMCCVLHAFIGLLMLCESRRLFYSTLACVYSYICAQGGKNVRLSGVSPGNYY